jgi:hypothetical protein
MHLAPANKHDGATLLPLVIDMPAVSGKVGRPKQKPDQVVADKGYDDGSLRRLVRWPGIEPVIPRRRSHEAGQASVDGAGSSNGRSVGSINSQESRVRSWVRS